ncbi:F-box only protein 5-like [Daktulosphaira vitifoliae]|uniref:F-box only protein 5-like n=1 Tax=Daktulosphaira vitifoliae TaxID=58002 RepID=UPI0021A9FDE1|nr:F-box only protein 5-like [Daktulosphaira vitifoliae]
MADLSIKESPYHCDKYKSFLFTSTPFKSIDDSGYDTSSSTINGVTSNMSNLSDGSINLDPTINDHSKFQSCSDISCIKKNANQKKDSVCCTDCKVFNKLPQQLEISSDLSPSKKFKFSSDLRMRFQLNKRVKKEKCRPNRKMYYLHNNINHERISLEDRKNVDIMYFLSERHHFGPVIEKIFSFLSDCDIVSVSLVSKVWNNAVKNSLIANKKMEKYFKLSKENRECERKDRTSGYNKGCLTNIENVMRSPVKRDLVLKSPPVSPSKYRWHVFQKEARKLNSDQRLIHCPLCRMPSSWSPTQSTRAQCHGIHCGYTFCTSCMCEYSNYSEHKCRSVPISSNTRRSLISSISKSKHNLRRL